jgi:acyl-CoA thioester hydrolase
VNTFFWPIRIYWEDTDAGGIVYYANYLKFMERARTEWLRSIGVEQERLQAQHNLMFVVVDVEAHYRRPARYGDILRVSCVVEERSRTTLTFRQDIFREQTGGDLLLDARVRVACLDAVKLKPRALPDVVLQEMNT